MFVRIVKMTFDVDKIERFISIFNENQLKIRNSEGCELLELYRDKANPTVFFTYSYWQEENHLENYRNSDLFKNVWAQTKLLFSDKPEAWSVDKLVVTD